MHGNCLSVPSQLISAAPPSRGPSGYQGRGQYYDVLNHFFRDGERVRVYARVKRLGDKRGWGSPEWVSGLELDRAFFYRLKLWECGARMDDLVKDGCEIVSYAKNPKPDGLVTYILVSWPTNTELERNRSTRVARKQPRQQKLPQAATPFQHPRFRITAEAPGRSETRQERALRFERQSGVRPPSVNADESEDAPLFAGVR